MFGSSVHHGSCGGAARRLAIRRRSVRLIRWGGLASFRRPEERLILLIDRDAITVRVGHRKGPSKGSVEGLGQDRYATCHGLLVECLGIARPPPKLDARGLGRRAGKSWPAGRRQGKRRPADERRRVRAEVEGVADRAQIALVKAADVCASLTAIEMNPGLGVTTVVGMSLISLGIQRSGRSIQGSIPGSTSVAIAASRGR